MALKILLTSWFSMVVIITLVIISVDTKRPTEQQGRGTRGLVALLVIAAWVTIGSVFGLIWGW